MKLAKSIFTMMFLWAIFLGNINDILESHKSVGAVFVASSIPLSYLKS